MRQAAITLGEDFKEELGLVETSVPTRLLYLYDIWSQIGRTRSVNVIVIVGMVSVSKVIPNPITFSDIADWGKVFGVKLDPWEVSAIMRIEQTYLEVVNVRSGDSKPSD